MKHDKLTTSEEMAVIDEILQATDNDDPTSTDLDRIPATFPNNKSTAKLYFLNELSKKEIIFVDPNEDYHNVAVLDSQGLAEHYRAAYVRSLHDGEPATIVYWPHAGLCDVNGHKIRLKGRNKRIFTVLFNHANRPLEKGAIWRAAGRRGTPRGYDDILTFNSYITNLRRALGSISSNQLRLNRTVELWALTYLTDENDLIKEKISTI